MIIYDYFNIQVGTIVFIMTSTGTHQKSEVWDLWKAAVKYKLEGDEREDEGEAELEPSMHQMSVHGKRGEQHRTDHEL